MLPLKRFAVFAILVTITVSVLIYQFKDEDESKTGRLVNLRDGASLQTPEPRFAYVQYATSLEYLCSATLNFGRLTRFGSKAEQVLIYPESWDTGNSVEAKSLQNFYEAYPDIVLRPSEVLKTDKGDETWHDSLMKLHAFGLTEYTRVLVFDSDTLVLSSMDQYFLAPSATIALPRAYWLNRNDESADKQILASHVMLIEPKKSLYKRIVSEALKTGDFDMDVVNHMFGTSAMVLPHRGLALLTGEFRSNNHKGYLGLDFDGDWNPVEEVNRSFLVHFSDWPLPKPWEKPTEEEWEEALPRCPEEEFEKPGQPRCADRVIWQNFYDEYGADQVEFCTALFRDVDDDIAPDVR